MITMEQQGTFSPDEELGHALQQTETVQQETPSPKA